MFRLLGFPVLFDRVSDHQNRVSIEVPLGWRYEAPSNGGTITTDNGSSGEGEPYRVVDVHAVSWVSGDDGGQHFDLEVFDSDETGTDLAKVHEQLVNDQCDVFGGCEATGLPQALTVDGYPALQQVFTADFGPTLYMSTAVGDGLAVRYTGYVFLRPDRGDLLAMQAPWLSTRF
ncbi:hypothetical protein SAMN04489747_2037 [Auraticoccus monumenti]|uniref:Uncharacterized protein n=2 Tax=Auraticoccus monumenti TaxID=675864 RepID=A0A1G6YM52_9ACTN|nr:hypothetical protein SAMN04489747_2037 [Auraticoccus monumenti]